VDIGGISRWTLAALVSRAWGRHRREGGGRGGTLGIQITEWLPRRGVPTITSHSLCGSSKHGSHSSAEPMVGKCLTSEINPLL
jgi:hypothetical protein